MQSNLWRSHGHLCGALLCQPFMDCLEETFLVSQNLKPLVWFRFIGNIFMIWTQEQDTLSSSFHKLNSSSPTNFIWSYPTQCATFPNVNLYLNNRSSHTSVYIKPSTTNGTYTLTVAITLTLWLRREMMRLKFILHHDSLNVLQSIQNLYPTDETV